jgi:hypothetical protein
MERAFLLEALTTVTPAMWGLESGDIYLPAANRRVLELTGRPGWTESTSQLFDVGYLVSSSSAHHRLHEGEGVVVADRPDIDLILVVRHGSPGRAFLAERSCFPDSSSLLAHLFQIDPRRDPPPGLQLCEPGPVAAPPAGEGGVGEARITEYSPERVVIDVKAARPGVLVLNDALAPGWTARVDDLETSIVRTNHLVRGVDVLAGSHRVTFTFRTPGLQPAAVASGAGWVGLLVAVGVLGRRRLAATLAGSRSPA